MKRDKAKIAGLVLAAGYSSRMGSFKPLLPLGDATVIEKSVGSLLGAGVKDVSVVVGWRANEIVSLLGTPGVKAVYNPHYDLGMYSSVVAGVGSLGPAVDAFLLLPGDYPLVKPHTVQSLIGAYLNSRAGIVYPRYLGRRGHPPLIERRYVEEAPDASQPGGLRTVLRRHEDEAIDVVVDDQGVIMDLDIPDDYAKALFRCK
ncbi:MAG: nucleotidyltransferase family protein [Chloroflexi bacterium]|nr:nucleotidyltransferase family protein [Chloroflexota bacterium]